MLRSVAFFVCCVSLLAQEPAGPLRMGEKNPLFRMFATPKAEMAALLNVGQWSFETSLAHSNVFERQDNSAFRQDFDMEITTLSYGVRRGFGKWEVGLEFVADSYAGGFLDHTIQEFHRVFGLANDDRDTVENGRFAFQLLDLQNGAVLQESAKDQWVFGDTLLHIKRRLRKTETSALSFWAQISTPTGREDVNSSGDLSGNLGLAWQKSFTNWNMYANVSGVWLNPSAPRDAIVEDAAVYGMFALERHLIGSWSALAQLDGGSAYVNNTGLDNLDDPPLNFILGVQSRFAKQWLFQFGFSEDLLADGPSVDFAVEAVIRQTF